MERKRFSSSEGPRGYHGAYTLPFTRVCFINLFLRSLIRSLFQVGAFFSNFPIRTPGKNKGIVAMIISVLTKSFAMYCFHISISHCLISLDKAKATVVRIREIEEQRSL